MEDDLLSLMTSKCPALYAWQLYIAHIAHVKDLIIYMDKDKINFFSRIQAQFSSRPYLPSAECANIAVITLCKPKFAPARKIYLPVHQIH